MENTNNTSSRPNGIPRGLWALVAGRFVLAAGFSLSYPFIAIYLGNHRHLPASWVGLMFAVSGIFVCLGMLAGGELSDLIGAKRVMVSSLLVRTLFAFAYSACIAKESSFLLFSLVHVGSSFLFGLFDPASQALLTGFSVARERMRSFALLRVGANAGWAIGPMLGGFVAEKSYALLFDVSGVAYLVAALMLLAMLPAQGAARPSDRFRLQDLWEALKDHRFAAICLLSVVINATMGQLVVGLSMYGTNELSLAKRQIGWLLFTNGVMVVAFQFHAARWMQHARLTTSLVLGCLLYAAGYLLVGFAGGFQDMLLAMLVITSGEIVVSPSMDTLAANLSPVLYRGRYRGVFSLSQQLGRVIGVAMSGLVLDSLPGMHVAQWVILASPAALAAFGYLRLRRRLSPEDEGGEILPGVLPAEEGA